MTPDFDGFSIPDFIHYILSDANINIFKHILNVCLERNFYSKNLNYICIKSSEIS